MNKIKAAALAAVVGAAVAFPTVSLAQMSMKGPDSGWYIGGGIGQSSMDVDTTGFAPGSSSDDKDTSFRVFGGYQINKHFGVELGYSQLGEATVTEPGFPQATFEAKAFDLVAVGTLPLSNNFSLIGKVGLYMGDVDASQGGGGASDSSTDITYGVGAQYDFNKNVGVRAEWQQFKKMGGSNVGESDVDVMSISVVYRFR